MQKKASNKFISINLAIVSSLKRIFAKKTLIMVSKGKIRNFELSSFLQICVVVSTILILNLYYQSTIFDQIISDKSEKISKLQKANNKFQSNLVSINNDLKKINKYFIIASYYEKSLDKKNENGLHNQEFNLVLDDLKLEESYKKTAFELASANAIMNKIKFFANNRTNKLKDKISNIGINLNINSDNDLIALSLNTKEELSKQGGPFEELNNFAGLVSNNGNTVLLEEKIGINNANMNQEIDYLSNLERFIHHAPLIRPMKDYYVSSSFGYRIDPIKKVKASHNGMDFVGPKHAEVLSPSVGKIKLVGKFGAYGKTIIIDHGYGITTRYGHLYKIKVKKGDLVSRGDVIALQGNTGRSTGSHLHYEIRYNGSPVNPKNFLKAGDNLFEKNDI